MSGPGLCCSTHNTTILRDAIWRWSRPIARGRVWFDELVSGRARSLQELAKRDGISRRYIRRLVGLTFLSPQLVEAILQGRQPSSLRRRV